MKVLHVAVTLCALAVAGLCTPQATAGLIDPATLTYTHQTWSPSTLTYHIAGGSATNFTGTNSVAFGDIGDLGYSLFELHPPAADFFDGSFSDSISASLVQLASTVEPADMFVVTQQVLTLRTSPDWLPDNSNSAYLKSVVEIETPDFGPGNAILLDLYFDDMVNLPYGGAATNALIDASVLNVTTGQTLFSLGPMSSSVHDQLILSAAPGDILRFSFEGTTSSELQYGPVNDFEYSFLSLQSTLQTVAAPETVVPEPTSIALLGIGLTGLAGARVRRQRKTRHSA